jgi:hypothetical protein
MLDRRRAYKVLVGKPAGKRPLERPRNKLNIKMDLLKIGWGRGRMDWSDLA